MSFVDACYLKADFTNDVQRVAFLFEFYQQLTRLLQTKYKAKKQKASSKGKPSEKAGSNRSEVGNAGD